MKLMKRLAGGAAFTLLAMASAGAYAQETTSAVRGDVIGADGKPAAGVSVAIVHTPSGTRATAVTNEDGIFDARGLRVGGPYTITTSGGGLEAKSLDGLNLTVGETERVTIDYAAQSVSEISVTGVANPYRDTGPKTVLSRDAVEGVATINRDIRDLARRDILVSQNVRNDGGISIAGSNPRTNRITIDGVSAQDPYGLETGGLPTTRGPVSLDAVEQFSIAAVPTDVTNGNFTGGALNMVLRSGSNDWHGSLYQNFLWNSTVGHWNGGTRVNSTIDQVNWGAFLSGPIWKDKIFIAASYETYATTETTLTGPANEGFQNVFSRVSRAQIEQVRDLFETYATYGANSNYDIGDIERTLPKTDNKYSVKLDWNISDKHRASVTLRHADAGSTSRTDLSNAGSGSAALYSHWYDSTYNDEAITYELNSKWTDALSTNFKITSRDWRKGQDSTGLGPIFADITVCTQTDVDNPNLLTGNSNYQACTNEAATGVAPGTVRFGPDTSRHANKLNISDNQFSGTATYAWGDHLFKGGYQLVDKQVFNLFQPAYRGVYYFDSVDDFRNGRASRLQYANAVSGNINDAAANLPYKEHSFYAQDSWELSETLKATLGVRMDVFKTDAVPTLNPNFVTRNGYANTKTIDGEKVIMPRLSIDWRPTENLKFNAGGGLFSGGFPEVLFATPYYNTGFVATTIEIQRCVAPQAECIGGTGTPGVAAVPGVTPGILGNYGYRDTSSSGSVAPGFTAAVGAAALDNLRNSTNYGFVIPQLVRDYQEGKLTPGGAQINPSAEVFALARDFDMPGEWKGYLQGQWDVGKGWVIDAQYVTTKASNVVTYTDARARPLVVNGVAQKTPDGRIRYDGLSTTTANRALAGITSTNPGNNRDFIAQSVDAGSSYTASLVLSKSYDFGLDFTLGAAWQSIDELSPGLRFGTTASGFYRDVPVGLDPNRDALGRGLEEIGHRYKTGLTYRKSFFGDNETKITLFGEKQQGRPFGFIMNDTASGRGSVFGVNRTAFQLYVPDYGSDTNTTDLNVGLVTFATTGDRDNFAAQLARFNIPTTGGMLSRFSATNKSIDRLDLQISQQLPTFIPGHKVRVQLDIRNLLNLMNSEWGRVEEFQDNQLLARVTCGNTAGVAVGTASAVCDRYIYSSVPTVASLNPTFNGENSVWYAQLSLRYEF